MPKVLAKLSKDAVLLDLAKQIDTENKKVDEEIDFLRRRAKALAEGRDKKTGPIFEKLRERLKETGDLPENYDKEKHVIYFDIEDDAVFFDEDGPCRQLPPQLAAIIKRLGVPIVLERPDGGDDKPRA